MFSKFATFARYAREAGNGKTSPKYALAVGAMVPGKNTRPNGVKNMTEKNNLHYYLFLSRPPGIGCQPDGFDIDSREAWLPRRDIGGIYCLGRCGWHEKLSPRDVWHYSLRPESEIERAELVFWDHKDGFSEWLREDYMSQPDEFLKEYADKGDNKAWAALVLKRQEEKEHAE